MRLIPSRKVAPPKRITATGIFYGFVPENFHPEETGKNYASLSLLLKPLDPFRKDYTVFSGLDHNLSGGHNATKFFLSGIPTTESKGFAEANPSIDQKAAQFVGGRTRFPSLVLDSGKGSEHTLSWTRNGNAIQAIRSLEKLYQMLFRKDDGPSRDQVERDLADKRSILDLTREQATGFQKGLGKQDREKLDQYFTSVRELENRIEQSRLWLDREKPRTDYALPRKVDSLTLRERTPFFYDLMTLALQTDSTRIITLAFTNLGKENGGLRECPRATTLSLTMGRSRNRSPSSPSSRLSARTQFSRFLGKLKEIEEPGGQTLLDNTMALLGSGMSNANSHSNRDLPHRACAGGGFKHGEHKHFARKRKNSIPLCNLYLSMLQNFGLELDRFNTSSGTLTGFEKPS